jgi:hypothetical protein
MLPSRQRTVSGGTLLRPYPQYSSVGLAANPSASSWYNALEVSLGHQFTSGLHFLLSYTWSKYEDTATGPTGWASGATTPVRNWYDTAAEKALNDDDIPHSFVASYIYELPVGKGKALHPKGVLGGVVGGWQVSGISTFKSGFPLSINSSFQRRPVWGFSPGGHCRQSYAGQSDSEAMDQFRRPRLSSALPFWQRSAHVAMRPTLC